jgi:hypothetical protein
MLEQAQFPHLIHQYYDISNSTPTQLRLSLSINYFCVYWSSLGAVVSYTNNSALTTATYNVTGMTTLAISGGTFSGTPIVICTPFVGSLPSDNVSTFYNYGMSSTTQVVYYTIINSVPTNLGMFVMIIGPA